MTVVLALSQIRKTFGDFVALDDASFELQQGEVTADRAETVFRNYLTKLLEVSRLADSAACCIRQEV